ncbi:MAG: hypothetical protein ACOCSR_01310 [Wenzhouxiangella sp.]
MAENRKEFIEKLKGKLDELDAQIDELKEKSRQFEGEAQKEYENRLHDLRAKRRHFKRRLEELHAASEEKWQAIKDETEHAWKALGNSFNYFKSHFR